MIGKTGRNWPIHAGIDQIKLISSSVKSAGQAVEDPATGEDDTYTRSRGSSQNVTRDPHASLSLFAPRQNAVQDAAPVAIAPKAQSAKPLPRDYHDLFVGNDSDQSSPGSPEKPANVIVPSPAKAGAGKNYAPSRLFEVDESEAYPPAPEKSHAAEHFYRPNPAKYQHFDFADGSDPQDAPKPNPPKDVKKSKHGSQWNFDDFTTPHKAPQGKVLKNDVRHWGNEDDEVVDSPIKQKQVIKPRKDAETNFEFQDDGTPDGGQRTHVRTRGAEHNTGLGLYKNNVYDEENRGEVSGVDLKRLDTIANVKDRSKDFEPHFRMSDGSPAPTASEHIPEDRAKAVKMMDASWTTYDQSPSQKENAPGATSKPTTGAVKGPLSETTNSASQRTDNPKEIVAGDGMGGRKGTGRQWGFGDESDPEEIAGKNKAGKTYRAQRPTGGDFWDF